MEEKYKKQSIERFNFINEENINKLKNNQIETLEQLSNKTNTELKEYGLENDEIDKIKMELQFLGLGLNNKIQKG